MNHADYKWFLSVPSPKNNWELVAHHALSKADNEFKCEGDLIRDGTVRYECKCGSILNEPTKSAKMSILYSTMNQQAMILSRLDKLIAMIEYAPDKPGFEEAKEEYEILKLAK